MERMRMETPDLTVANVEKIGALFPNCVTESTDEYGKLKKAINFDLLRQMLSSDVVEGDEAYEFTWVGKKAAIVEANKPIRKTLRPCPEESVDWDTTENLYIEGDNLDVLKLLQESYLGKVQLIYIDPPYNTGNDFIYRDDYAMALNDYEEQTGSLNEEGERLFKNTDANGRFHSDWCNMIYARLLVARNLLSEDGAIFISIDDHEQADLKLICDEIFGAQNFITDLIWQHSVQSNGYGGKFVNQFNHTLVYAKSSNFHVGLLPRTDEDNKLYKNPDNDPRGPWRSGYCVNGLYRPNLKYEIVTPSGKKISPPEKGWRWSQETLYEKIAAKEIVFNDDETGIIHKLFLRDLEGKVPENIWAGGTAGTTRQATAELKELFQGKAPFDTPKPVEFIKRIVALSTNKDSLVVDFFSGSATTAHAVIQLNADDGGHRRFIMVQLPEKTDERNKYEDISKVGMERIRRAGKKIKEESPLTTQDLDIGFRVFKLDSSNMNDVYFAAGDYTQDLLTMLESNVKSDRTDLDLLFGCLLEWGLPLSMPYKSEKIEGCTVHTYNDGDLIACFDENIPDTVIKEIARRQPLRAVFRDSSFNDSPAKINVGEIFKMLAPDTRIKVI